MKKFKGSGLLIMTVISAAIMGLISVSLVKMHSTSLYSLTSNKINLQSQFYAKSKGDFINLLGYDALKSQQKQPIINTNFSDKVTVGEEKISKDNIRYREVLIEVFYDKEIFPRYSLNDIISKSSSVSSGSQIVTNTDGAVLISNGNYSSVTVIASSNFIPTDGSWTGKSRFNITINGQNIGTFDNTTTTSKAGSRGHYWGTTENVSNQKTIRTTVKEGDRVSVSLNNLQRHKSSTVTIILGN